MLRRDNQVAERITTLFGGPREIDMPTPSNLQLAALMCSRLCHDLVGPIGAVSNGAELLEEADAELASDAHALIAKSAGQAVRRLRFYRLAFGANASANTDWQTAMQTAEPMFKDAGIALSWSGEVEGEDAARAGLITKFALNLVLLAAAGLPRGGSLALKMAGSVAKPEFTVAGQGVGAAIDEAIMAPLSGGCRGEVDATDSLDARAVQPYLTGMLAADLGIAVSVPVKDQDRFEVRAAVA